jgi:hypothetical protein
MKSIINQGLFTQEGVRQFVNHFLTMILIIGALVLENTIKNNYTRYFVFQLNLNYFIYQMIILELEVLFLSILIQYKVILELI